MPRVQSLQNNKKDYVVYSILDLTLSIIIFKKKIEKDEKLNENTRSHDLLLVLSQKMHKINRTALGCSVLKKDRRSSRPLLLYIKRTGTVHLIIIREEKMKNSFFSYF